MDGESRMWRGMFCWVLCCVIVACGGDDPVAPPTLPGVGLIAFYPFDADASDAGGSARNGTLLGGAAVSDGVVLRGNDADGVSLPASVLAQRNSFTISVWVRLAEIKTANYILSAANDQQAKEFGIWYEDATGAWNVGFDGDVDAEIVDARIRDNGWHHLAVTRSGALGLVYLDGAQIGSPEVFSDLPLFIDTGGLILGQDQGGVGSGFDASVSLNGALDQLRVYSRALDAADILLLSQEER